jgi:hypothetical protein
MAPSENHDYGQALKQVREKMHLPMENGEPKAIEMPEVWQVFGLCDGVREGITFLPQPLQDVKLIAICMGCFQK